MNGTTTIIIFGASGDLTKRKLIPSLFNLYCKDRMPERWRIVGVSRTPWSDEEYREQLKKGILELAPDKYEAKKWRHFISKVSYRPGNLGNLEDFRALDGYLAGIEEEDSGPANRVYYLSVAPRLYQGTIAFLGEAGMVNQENGWRRVVIEKPFGHDYNSARELNTAVHKVLQESQIYRIDHYLGKETVQNLLVFRFANSLFEPVWNRNYIDHVQITAMETVDVQHRAGYYDGVGVMRDMVQNHMLQLLALVAIEPPASFDADALRNEKVKLLSSIRHVEPDQVLKQTIRGQYEGYRKGKGVAPGSQTATYVAIRLFVDNWRWQGVPFYLRSGKALAQKKTAISIFFKRPPHVMFPLPAEMDIAPNHLSICVQPDEEINFSFQAKVPDSIAEMRTVEMNFDYQDYFGANAIPDAYERLLLDVIKGDASLFTRGDAIELAWGFVDKILAGWDSEYAPLLFNYERGSWGPDTANDFIAHEGYSWSRGCQ